VGNSPCPQEESAEGQPLQGRESDQIFRETGRAERICDIMTWEECRLRFFDNSNAEQSAGSRCRRHGRAIVPESTQQPSAPVVTGWPAVANVPIAQARLIVRCRRLTASLLMPTIRSVWRTPPRVAPGPPGPCRWEPGVEQGRALELGGPGLAVDQAVASLAEIAADREVPAEFAVAATAWVLAAAAAGEVVRGNESSWPGPCGRISP
jgi:hypothetical protein